MSLLPFLPSLLPPFSLLLGALVLQTAVSEARAESETGAEVTCLGPLPFTQGEMEDALRARRHLLGRTASVVVRAKEGRTLVRVGSAEREVELGGRGGEDAARIVAVLALDLAAAETPMALSQTESGAGSGADSGAATAAVSVEASVVEKAPPRETTPRERAFRAGLALHSPFDQAGWVAHLEPTLDLALEVAAGVGGFVTAGYRHASAGANTSRGWASLEMHELPLRAGVTYQRRWLELRLGGTARPRVVSGAGEHRGASWGASLSGAARWPLTPKLAVVLAAGLDVFRSRMVFAIQQDTVLSTPWLCPWLGAGLSWEAAL